MKDNTNIENKNDNIFDVIVVGGGPGGMTAAIFTKRANLNVAIIEKNFSGGKMIFTTEIENYPGYISILGSDLATKMTDQVMKLGTVFLTKTVTEIKPYSILRKSDQKDNKLHQVITAEGDIYYARAIIISTGTLERRLGVPGEDKYYSHGVSYCAICDAVFYRDLPVAVVGGGNSAFQESYFLSRFASIVYLIHRRKGFRASDILVQKVKNNPKIKMILDTVVTEIKGDSDKVTNIMLKNTISNEIKNLTVSAIFPYIGANPISNFVSKLNITDNSDCIVVNKKQQTIIPGIYAIGDVTNTPLRQITTAVGEGSVAGQESIGYIDGTSSDWG